jgi:alpha-mannosidase
MAGAIVREDQGGIFYRRRIFGAEGESVMRKWILFAAAAAAILGLGLGAKAPAGQAAQNGPKPNLYIISNSHLDTQWNWTVQDTIRDLIPRTFFDNFKLFEKFPDYVFNYEGAIHYMWFKEYYPDRWATVQKYVDAGRWKLSGAWINAADTHVPSPEALMRQALYGKSFFRREFGRVPLDVYLPDCFGFGYALPASANHSGLTAFSTQKLSWGAATPPPFAVGRWKGVDGSSLIASIRAGDYVKELRSDVSIDPKWNADLVDVGGGAKVGFRYFGVGDQGGAPDSESVGWLEKAIANRTAPVAVRNTSADQLARDLTPEQKAALPEYEGEFLLKTHGVGCFTSQAAMKTWNRKNELLADAAERASLAAEWLGGPAYPRDELRTAWIRFLWHQFHDDLTGTSIPQAYRFSWNDELLSLNQFAGITTGAAGAVASGMDTRGAGVPLVVFNPLALTRRDPVEAAVRFDASAPAAVRVVDAAAGKDVPAQVLSIDGRTVRILFLADLPAVGFKVFHVLPAADKGRPVSALKVTESTLENERYAVKLDANGDVASILDRDAGRELLSGPARLELLSDLSTRWPAWEITWAEASRPARAYAASPRIRIVERGPARVALEVTRTAGDSTFVQRLSLAAGSDRLDFETSVDWRSTGTMLKASFPFAAANPKAVYDLGLGTIERPNARENLYEVPGQQWADLTDAGGGFGAAVFNDGKYGWDKPADNIVRLTLIHTPKPGKSYVYQSTNDIGRHNFTYAIAGHAGDWRTGRIPTRAARLNQPLLAFQTDAHGGLLGRGLSMLTVAPDGGSVAVRAFKKAEASDEIVIRIQELFGQAAMGVRIALAAPITAAREVNAAEEPLGTIDVIDGGLRLDLARYQTRTFLLRTAAAPARLTRPVSSPLPLPYDIDGVSPDTDRRDGDFNGRGKTIPAELFPEMLTVDGVSFRFGPVRPGARNILAADGQRLALPAGGGARIHILASALGGDIPTTFTFERPGAPAVRVPVTIAEWEGAFGQWDSRLTDDRLLREEFLVDTLKGQEWPLPTVQAQMAVTAGADGVLQGFDRLQPAFVKRDRVVWVATHRHTPKGNEAYSPAYLFRYVLDIPVGATALVLPADKRIRVFAATAAKGDFAGCAAAGELYAGDVVRRPAAAR